MIVAHPRLVTMTYDSTWLLWMILVLMIVAVHHDARMIPYEYEWHAPDCYDSIDSHSLIIHAAVQMHRWDSHLMDALIARDCYYSLTLVVTLMMTLLLMMMMVVLALTVLAPTRIPSTTMMVDDDLYHFLLFLLDDLVPWIANAHDHYHHCHCQMVAVLMMDAILHHCCHDSSSDQPRNNAKAYQRMIVSKNER